VALANSGIDDVIVDRGNRFLTVRDDIVIQINGTCLAWYFACEREVLIWSDIEIISTGFCRCNSHLFAWSSPLLGRHHIFAFKDVLS
jgi:hypothetical protein